MSARLALQEPSLAWASAAQAGQLQGLGWAESRSADDLLASRGPDGDTRFATPPVTTWLPPSVALDAARADALGQVSAWEALSLILARGWWWVASAEHLWSSYSPSVAAQARSVERFGVSAEHHRGDPERLAHLVAALPRWASTRGQLDGVRLICNALKDPSVSRLERGPVASVQLVCRSSQSWAGRPPRIGQLSIQAGRVVAADPREPRVDELTLNAGAEALPRLALRLLPVWTTLRLAPPSSRAPNPEPPPRSDP